MIVRRAATRAAWHVGTVTAAEAETSAARRLVLDVPTWPGNVAGQHLDVRLTAPNGYQATRSYSLASSGPSMAVELVVAEVPDGEVSPFLVHDLRAGDAVEVHGPLGAFFVWRPPEDGTAAGTRPVQLVAGGSGVVPLLAMVRSHVAAGDATSFRLLYSVRTPSDVFFPSELDAAAAAGALGLDLVYTRQTPAVWPDPPGRLTHTGVEKRVIPAVEDPLVFVCGPTGFVETVAQWLVDLGHRPASIRTERFGGT
ncbi:MAG: FAD-binding oxidoreductase [Lapillicoccus sp.]